MARRVTSVVQEGNGIRLTWSDNTISQYIWTQTGQNFALRDSKTGGEISGSLVTEIIDSLSFGLHSQSLHSHLFGLAGDHLSAAAVTQIGDGITQDTWTRVIYDDIQVESHSSGLSVNTTSGVLSFSGGEWNISGHVQIHKTSSAAINFMIQLWDETLSQEVPRTFRVRSTSAKTNAPASIRVAALLDLNSTPKDVSIRVRVDASDAVFGTLPGDIPAGSTNSVGLLNITRVG